MALATSGRDFQSALGSRLSDSLSAHTAYTCADIHTSLRTSENSDVTDRGWGGEAAVPQEQLPIMLPICLVHIARATGQEPHTPIVISDKLQAPTICEPRTVVSQ